ncbi:hypothetical protein DO021_12805 [Desulfobacter hydrogenophilus]|uniref:Sulfotransferase n=1 Tax=Desulfobacter hydrogenophilus TaxID=2291 RepID=A0A328FAH8_9BACT|nr:sulfotransferase [Desulfobacter hydrogenophilus]NDY74106.1 sulfotransferase [Desulfobacter hydrogenophilus]QBH14090.1 sulfotransferase [Desulfobacter hydrogenophilus]RAM01651.1 hypothetical protein DO021_12805 [Desulfobacter hydrogenophilus]
MNKIDTKTRRLVLKVLSHSLMPAGRLFQGVSVKDLLCLDTARTGIVFIVGAPRTGTTLFYQILTNLLDVGYLSNLSNLFYHSLFSGMVLHDRVYGNRPHNNFTSDSGRTRGLISVNESGKFWYQWYPKNVCSLTNDMLSGIDFSSMVNTIRNIQHRLKKPLVFKNQTNSQRVASLAKLFPDSVFVHVVRDPLPVAGSIIRHRKRFLGSVDKWYSIKPDNYEQIKDLGYVDQVVHQLHGVDRMIEHALQGLDPKRSLKVDYEDICRSWPDVVSEVKKRLELFGPVQERRGALSPEIRFEGAPVEKDDVDIMIEKKIRQIYG